MMYCAGSPPRRRSTIWLKRSSSSALTLATRMSCDGWILSASHSNMRASAAGVSIPAVVSCRVARARRRDGLGSAIRILDLRAVVPSDASPHRHGARLEHHLGRQPESGQVSWTCTQYDDLSGDSRESYRYALEPIYRQYAPGLDAFDHFHQQPVAPLRPRLLPATSASLPLCSATGCAHFGSWRRCR